MRIHAILFAFLTGLAGYASAQATSAPSQAQPPFPMPKAQSPEEFQRRLQLTMDAMPKRQSPEEIQHMLQSTMGAMMPMIAKMSEAQLDVQLAIAERPETAERIATFKRNLFDALVRKGFTVEDSVKIVSGTQLPAASITK